MNRDERIAQWLVEREILRPADLSEALNRSNVTGEPLWEILKEMGRLNDDQISYLLARLNEDDQTFDASERPTEALGEDAAPIWRAFEGLGDFGQSRQILAQSTHVLDPKNPEDPDEEVGELNLDQNLPPRLKVYRDFRMVGRGGMGSVYVADHRDSGQTVAIKFLFKAKLTTRDIERFRREFLAISRLDHPSIIKVLDYSFETAEDDGRPIPPYLVMEWIEGDSLHDYVLNECGMDLDKRRDLLVPLFGHIAAALSHAHDKGVIHRDLKPANILIEAKTQRPVIVDFGLVKFDSSKVTDLDSLTASGVMIGTPSYMPPEQLFGYRNKIGERVDVWSFAATFFHCLTGELPFAADNVVQQVLLIKSRDARRLSAILREIPSWLDDLVAQCFSREPEQRPSMSEVLVFIKDPVESSSMAASLKQAQGPLALSDLLSALTKPPKKAEPFVKSPLFLSSLGLFVLSLVALLYALFDHQAPSLVLATQESHVRKSVFHLKGQISDKNPCFLRVKRPKEDWVRWPVQDEFSLPIELKRGENQLLCQAEDDRGNQGPIHSVKVVYDTHAPHFEVLKCMQSGAFIRVFGMVSEPQCTVYVGSRKIDLIDRAFSVHLKPPNNVGSIELRCLDRAGNLSQEAVAIPE